METVPDTAVRHSLQLGSDQKIDRMLLVLRLNGLTCTFPIRVAR